MALEPVDVGAPCPDEEPHADGGEHDFDGNASPWPRTAFLGRLTSAPHHCRNAYRERGHDDKLLWLAPTHHTDTVPSLMTAADNRSDDAERDGHLAQVRSSAFDRLLRPLHRWVWSDARRRGGKLLRFAQTEADGGRDLSRAAELTSDALLRRLYLRHAQDEQRHADLFRVRGRAVLAELAQVGASNGFQANWFSPGERGLDDLRVDRASEASLLAFLHLSEKAAAGRFALYHEVLDSDPTTRAVFTNVLRDEAFHMNYTYAQLKRLEPRRSGARLWWARASRMWKAYLRLATAIANVLGGIMLTVQYFVLLPIFVVLAKRAERRELPGWSTAKRAPSASLRSQY